MDNISLSEIINQLGEDREKYFGAVAPPIVQTSNFAFPDTATMRDFRVREFEEHIYSRGNNPTVKILRQKLAALEKTEDALVFSSGSAAVAAAVISQVKAGDHVVCVNDVYGWTQKLLGNLLPKFKVETTIIDGSKIENFEAAIQSNTVLIYLESPSSFVFDLQNLNEVAGLAREKGIRTIIDNSYSSPLYQNPAEMGIDIVIHSASKYLSGHSDVVAGVLCSSEEIVRDVFSSEFMTIGSKLGPFEAWLMLRGLRTLEIRLERSSATAEKVTNWLAERKEVKRVMYPFHSSHPQLELARKQMKGSGGLFTIEFDFDDYLMVEHFADSLQHVVIGVSWGGHESIVFPASAGVDSPDPENPRMKYMRLYCGLESPDLLIADLEQAFDSVKQKFGGS